MAIGKDSHVGYHVDGETIKPVFAKDFYKDPTPSEAAAKLAEVSSLTTEYVPKAGDVVEFNTAARSGLRCVGLVITDDRIIWETKGVVSGARNAHDLMWNDIESVFMTSPLKINTLESCDNFKEAEGLLVKYFAQPTFEGTYKQRQAQWVKHYGVKVGTKVKVVRKPTPEEMAEDTRVCGYWGDKSYSIGKILKVRRLGFDWCMCLENGTKDAFPYYTLEVV